MIERPHLEVPTPPGGWPAPWPRVAEIAQALGPEHWTLVGGLMVQLHAIAAGITSLRPTDDVDMLIHIETASGRPREVAIALESLGYALQPSIDPTNKIAHRFTRGTERIDVSVREEVVDVVTADHAAPSQVERLRGYDLMQIEGGTQALRRTINATLHVDDQPLTVSVPNPYGALILKSAAHLTDSRDKQRHLSDAVTLLACIEDPFAIADKPVFGSDAKRLRHLVEHLDDPTALAWSALDGVRRGEARAALQILLNGLDGR